MSSNILKVLPTFENWEGFTLKPGYLASLIKSEGPIWQKQAGAEQYTRYFLPSWPWAPWLLTPGQLHLHHMLAPGTIWQPTNLLKECVAMGDYAQAKPIGNRTHSEKREVLGGSWATGDREGIQPPREGNQFPEMFGFMGFPVSVPAHSYSHNSLFLR